MRSGILLDRLRNQKLVQSDARDLVGVVSWLGAVQSQDYAGAKWALSLRVSGLSDADVDRAFDTGAIVRTHILRPTWHFVAPADIRWMLALTGPRVLAGNRFYCRKSGLDEKVLARSRRVLEKALGGGKFMTRTALGAVLARAGIEGEGQRLAYLMMDAELQQVVCSGPRAGKQFTYALLDERAPRARVLARRGGPGGAHAALLREPRTGDGGRFRVVVRPHREAGKDRTRDAGPSCRVGDDRRLHVLVGAALWRLLPKRRPPRTPSFTCYRTTTNS